MCRDMVKGRVFFANGGTNLHILHVRNTCGNYETGLILMLDPQNLCLHTLFLQLSVAILGILCNGGLICTKRHVRQYLKKIT